MLLALQNIMDDFICALQKKLLLQGMGSVRTVCAHRVHTMLHARLYCVIDVEQPADALS